MKILLKNFEKILKIHCNSYEKIFNCVKYQENLIQQYLNEISLLKLKKLRTFLKILQKLEKKLKIYNKNLK